jgi:DNA-binding transcriptional LysR family regulator
VLLEKAGRGVRLADAARVLSQHAATMLTAAEAASVDLDSLSGDIRGSVRADGLQSATRRVLIPALASVWRDHPGIRVEISETELEQALPELLLGSLDVVISDDYDGHPRPRPAGLRSPSCTRNHY